MTSYQFLRGLLGAAFLGTALFASSHAMAGVSNPDYYFVDISFGSLQYIPTGGGRITAITGQIEGDLGADGSFDYAGSTFDAHPTSVAGVKARLITVTASRPGSSIDPSINKVYLELRMRIKFEGSGVPTTCQTGLFEVGISTHKWSTQWGTVGLNPITGYFEAVAEDFSIPAVTATACGGTLAANLNSVLGFGSAPGNTAIRLYGSITNPSVPQP